MDSVSRNDDAVDILRQFIGASCDVYKYLHNTRTQEIAERIMAEGFRFEKYLENTTDFISGSDIVQIKYFRQIRASYGEFTLVIQIGKALADYYTNLLRGTEYHFSEVFSFVPPELSVDNEPVYTLAPQFIKGFFDQRALICVDNPVFDPHADRPEFLLNVERLKAMTGI